MAEERLINTRTNVNISGNSISIHTFYTEPEEFVLEFFVPLQDEIVQSINFLAGDLGYTQENNSDIFEINQNGELIVSSPNADKYSIDSNGDLIYTE